MIQHDEATRLAIHVLSLRQRRTDHLPALLFGEPAWGLLLVMFIADARGERLTAAEACRRAGGTVSGSMRWLAVLEEQGLTACRDGLHDDRLVAMTPAGVHAVEACMNDARRIFQV